MSDIYRSKEQRQFATRVGEHLTSGGSPLLLEGAAGLGKTRAYLAPLLACAKPIAICVPTRALAAQLVACSDMAAVRTGQPLEIFTPRRNFESVEQYKLHKQACQHADILICTHQAALIDVLADGALLGLRDRYAVLFDEADQLPDAATLRFDCAIDKYTLDILNIKPGTDHRKTVAAVLKVLPGHLDKVDEPAVVKAACRGLIDALDDPVWYQSVGIDDEGALRLVHQLPARVLKRILTHQRLVFVSATLTINGTFEDFKRALGLKDVSPWSTAIEPVHHGRLDVVS